MHGGDQHKDCEGMRRYWFVPLAVLLFFLLRQPNASSNRGSPGSTATPSPTTALLAIQPTAVPTMMVASEPTTEVPTPRPVLPILTPAWTPSPAPALANPSQVQPSATVAPEQPSAIRPIPTDLPALAPEVAPPTPAVVHVPSQPAQPVRLIIPMIDLDMRPVAVGLDEERVPIVPRHDIGWYEHSAMPGQG